MGPDGDPNGGQVGGPDSGFHVLYRPIFDASASHISSALLERWQNLTKLTNQRVYQILVYPERPFVKFAHRRSFASSIRALLIFSRALFRAVPQLTERLEEPNNTEARDTKIHVMKNSTCITQ